MCGNYNNDKSDDNLKPDSTPAKDDIELGNSWRSEGDDDPGSVSDTAHKFITRRKFLADFTTLNSGSQELDSGVTISS